MIMKIYKNTVWLGQQLKYPSYKITVIRRLYYRNSKLQNVQNL